MSIPINKKYLSGSIILIVVGVLSRTIFHTIPNVELITSIGIIAGYFFHNKKYAYLTVLATMVLSDFIIGNTVIVLFTWSAFSIAPIFSSFIKNKDGVGGKTFRAGIAAVSFTMFFFLWTNLGVVLTTNMYTRDLFGLLQSYYNALPFLLNQLMGNLILVPLSFWLTLQLETLLIKQPIVWKLFSPYLAK
jgi:hypothetical protein